ncbi:MAG TPA: hypothetical protein VHO91_00575 [Rhodopila sp.]|nr:hypothetical protein [Rhodopila sp.]
MGVVRQALVSALLVRAAVAQPAADTQAHIFVPPPRQWDRTMLNDRPALQQTPTDLANLTGGIRFGMEASAINALLTGHQTDQATLALPFATEYPGQVHYLTVPFADSGPLRLAGKACTGAGSSIVLLFNDQGLFRISYRLLPGKNCADTTEAARAIFARYVPIGPEVAFSVRYRTGNANVVDITDPTASFLIPIRWRQEGI